MNCTLFCYCSGSLASSYKSESEIVHFRPIDLQKYKNSISPDIMVNSRIIPSAYTLAIVLQEMVVRDSEQVFQSTFSVVKNLFLSLPAFFHVFFKVGGRTRSTVMQIFIVMLIFLSFSD